MMLATISLPRVPRGSAVGTPLVVLVAVVAILRIATASGGWAQAPDAFPQGDGQRVYNDFCVTCHMPEGEGLGENIPPLAGSEWATGDAGRLVRIIMHGVTGPIMVAGTEYNSLMPGLGQVLDDTRIAAVATYVRSAWGHDASEVAPEEVAAIRAQHPDRNAPWTATELRAMPAAGSSN